MKLQIAATILWCVAAGCAASRPRFPQWDAAATALVMEAVEQIEAGKLEHAEAALALAAELSPADARVLDGLGCIAWKRGETAKAEAFFQASSASDSGYEDALLHLAYAKLPDAAAARTLVEQALMINPLNPLARSMLAAITSERLDRLTAGYASYDNALPRSR